MKTFQRTVWAAISEGRFLSRWSLFGSLGVALTFMSPYFTPATGGDLVGAFVASAVSWCVLLVLLLPASWLERYLQARIARVLVLVVFVSLASALRPVLHDLILTAWGAEVPTLEMLAARVVLNLAVWWTVLILLAVLRNQVHSLRELNRRLGEVAESMRADAEAFAEKARQVRETVASCQHDLAQRLEAVLRAQRRDETAAAILAFSAGPVREWSRALSDLAAAPNNAGERRTNEPARGGGTTWRVRLPPAGTVTLVYLVLVSPYATRALSVPVFFTVLGVLVVSSVLIEWVTRSLLATAAEPRQFGWYVSLWALAGALNSATVAPSHSVPLNLVWFPVLVLPILAMACSWSAGMLHGLSAEGDRLEAMIMERRLRLAEGAAAPRDALERAARLLHRDVQANCLLYAATTIDAEAQRRVLAELTAGVESLAGVFDQAEDASASMPGIEAVIGAWSGVIDVHLDVEPEAYKLVNSSQVLARHIGEVVAEGLINTVKHAEELRARISISSQHAGAGRVVLVEVHSPGVLSGEARVRRDSPVGLIGAELTQELGEVRLSARLAVLPVVSAAHFVGAATG